MPAGRASHTTWSICVRVACVSTIGSDAVATKKTPKKDVRLHTEVFPFTTLLLIFLCFVHMYTRKLLSWRRRSNLPHRQQPVGGARNEFFAAVFPTRRRGLKFFGLRLFWRSNFFAATTPYF